MSHLSRRRFLVSSVSASVVALSPLAGGAEDAPEPIIDIHQHTNYRERTNAQLIAHQRAMGVTQTILLQIGRAHV